MTERVKLVGLDRDGEPCGRYYENFEVGSIWEPRPGVDGGRDRPYSAHAAEDALSAAPLEDLPAQPRRTRRRRRMSSPGRPGSTVPRR